MQIQATGSRCCLAARNRVSAHAIYDMTRDGTMSEQEIHRIAVHVAFVNKVNFACHHSTFALLRELQIENLNPEQDLSDLRVTLEATPAFLKSKTWTLDCLVAGGRIAIQDRDLELDGAFLFSLSESLQGEVRVRVSSQTECLSETVLDVEVLARNEWGGTDFMPELLAAFCVPNDPVVGAVLGEARRVLRKAGKDDVLDGYRAQSRERAWLLASAIYSAIAKLQVGYALPPVSFEHNGQKIRLPEQVAESRVATCLEITLLFAAALEQAGLNPLLVLTEGHALVGLWLQSEELSSIVVDEADILRQRIPLKELILIDTTLLTSHPVVPFSSAVKIGIKAISLQQDDQFVAAIDVRRARSHCINPVCLRPESLNTVAEDETTDSIEPGLEAASGMSRFGISEVDSVAEDTPQGRMERWQRKLLDLSARNPLLNHHLGKTSLPLVCSDPDRLENVLASGARLSIAPFPEIKTRQQDAVIGEQRTGDDLKQEYARDALGENLLLVDLPADELGKRSIEIYRKAQTSLKESGANTLFLAVGFLLWKPKGKGARRYRAPLILLPVALERKSVRSGIRLTAGDDDPRFNSTLLELLKKNFGIEINGLDGPLPRSQNGVDVDGIWNRVRQAIKSVPGVEVAEEVVLGHFSFAKYLMWRDLVDRSGALKQNPVVRHLMDTPREPYESGIGFVEPQVLDTRYTPTDLLTPLPADASQMAAIATADKGKDFVIIGPPGTGKSQTISNLIAHMLGKGKKVLFVSEKAAALEVVHRRLKENRLGQFCLELHSNKARKADVLNQLRTAWDTASRQDVHGWKADAERLKVLRDRLNRVVNSLHQPRRNGLTAYHAIGVKVRDEALAARVRLSWPRADYHSESQLQRLREVADRLAVQYQAVGELVDHPLKAIVGYEWTPQWQEALGTTGLQLQLQVHKLQQDLGALTRALGLSDREIELTRLPAMLELGQVLLGASHTPVTFALEPEGADRLVALEEAVVRLKAYAELPQQLSCPYAPQAWKRLNTAQLEVEWEEAKRTWWPKSQVAKRQVLDLLREGGAQGQPDPDQDLPVLQQLRETSDAIERLTPRLQGLRDWHGYDSDLRVLERLHGLGSRIRLAVGRLANDADSLIRLRTQVRRLLQEASDLLQPEASLGRAIVRFQESMQRFNESREHFGKLVGNCIDSHLPQGQVGLAGVDALCQQIIDHQASLKDWCGWMRRRTEAQDHQLGPLVEAVESGQVPGDEIREAFEAAYCAWWSAAIIGEDEVLRTFSLPEHEAAIQQFRTLDTAFSQLTARYIAAKLASDIPNQDDIRRSSSWGVLRQELQKETGHKPVRALMAEIPDVITSLAPCLMMSPLSIAQFLPAQQRLFDAVIFDEASQITVWDAVGSLARGKQIIVAGDPKQMPPTNFFTRSDEDPDGEVDREGDLESILDELIGANIPQRVLNLHYRSRRESLIAFSNSRYYDNALITFPAPVHPDRGVRLVRPDGFYARGKARHNLGEARAVVSEILRRLSASEPRVRAQSIGVVTFNTEQQTLIEDLLDRARTADPSIEWAFSDEAVEPVFVKNLETVQGDERDVILFSITYGPDEAGHVSMNFGPLNRRGGERRLNVAMTRARSEMLVFSTLMPQQIDLSRTQARAVADLKQFLEYAERGPAALGAAVSAPPGAFDSPFEMAVARALQDKGWTVHPQVGVSAYRIDLGIVHPDRPGSYLAGIECDGAMYHSAVYAHERDKIRQAVLEGLGWTLFRAWSTDWWTHRERALESLHERLQACLEATRNTSA